MCRGQCVRRKGELIKECTIVRDGKLVEGTRILHAFLYTQTLVMNAKQPLCTKESSQTCTRRTSILV